MAKKLTAVQELNALKAEKAAFIAENARLKHEIAAAEKKAAGSLVKMGITTKGTAVTLYIAGFKFPLTLFPSAYNAIIDNADDIKAHFIEHGIAID